MRQNFERSLQLVLKHEGGWSDHPADPGGATNKGITLATYRGWKKNNRLTKEDLRRITDAEVAQIYRERYWNAVRGDDLPHGLDYAVFDFAVNSGPSRAIKFLQRAVGATDDGIIGPQTMLAVNGKFVTNTIRALCGNRLAWLKTLSTWSTFGRGWERRVNEVQAAALGMIGANTSPPPRQPDDPGPVPREERKPSGLIEWIIHLIRKLFGSA